MPRNFLTTAEWTREELEGLLAAAARFKKGEDASKPLAGKSMGLVFFNPSLRTRASMQVGVYELGGNAVVLEPGGTSWTLEHREGVVMDGDKTQHVKEFVRVLARYTSAVGVRTFAALKDWREERQDPVLAAFARYSDVPVINLESAMHHPCQALADMLTVRERLCEGRKRVLLTWAWHPKPLPMAVPNSFALASAQMGHDLTIAHPQSYELDDELMRDIQNQAERAEYRQDWIVDEKKMARTRAALFMHCLPVRRNVIVADGVIDSPSSVVIDEAENRLHVQKAIMARLVNGK